jgi:hypothetical protein
MAWSEGEIIVRRKVWRGSPWMAVSLIVVADEPELLATYLPPGAQFVFPAGDHGLGPHPWHGRGGWQGHGVLMLQRPGERYAVWHFWDTYDLELDIWMPAAGGWSFKDDELLDVRVQEGRFTAAEAAEIRAFGAEIGAMLARGGQWWDPSWSRWEPDPDWSVPAPGAGWEAAPTT